MKYNLIKIFAIYINQVDKLMIKIIANEFSINIATVFCISKRKLIKYIEGKYRYQYQWVIELSIVSKFIIISYIKIREANKFNLK